MFISVTTVDAKMILMNTVIKLLTAKMFYCWLFIVFAMRTSAFNYDVGTVKVAPPSKLGSDDVMLFSFLIKQNTRNNNTL